MNNNHFDHIKGILPKIQQLRETQISFLASQTVFEDTNSAEENDHSTPIKIKKMSVNKSLKNTGNISKAKDLDQRKVCIICFQAYSKNELIRELKCEHRFHKKCIDKWFYPKYHEDEELACPLCRQDALMIQE